MKLSGKSLSRLLTQVVAGLTQLNANGVKILVGATSRVVADTEVITNTYGSDFLLTKLIIREVVALDDDIANSLGVAGTPQLYHGIFNLQPSDFDGGNVVTIDNFGSGIPIAAGSDFLVTAGGPAAVGALEYTLVGNLL